MLLLTHCYLWCQICREFLRGNCKRPDSDCRFAHPPEHVQVDASGDGLVTVCMDFLKGRCSRDSCRYLHPPAHLQAQLKSRAPSEQANPFTQTHSLLPLLPQHLANNRSPFRLWLTKIWWLRSNGQDRMAKIWWPRLKQEGETHTRKRTSSETWVQYKTSRTINTPNLIQRRNTPWSWRLDPERHRSFSPFIHTFYLLSMMIVCVCWVFLS